MKSNLTTNSVMEDNRLQQVNPFEHYEHCLLVPLNYL